MTHSDDAGLVIPPKLAPTHVAIVVIGKGEERGPVAAKAHAVAEDLRRAGLSVIVDDDESKGPGFKYFEYELAGVCLRMELGPKDLAKGACVLVRRDDRTKETVPLDQAVAWPGRSSTPCRRRSSRRRRAFRDANTFAVGSMEEMKARADDGFLLAQWCESHACEARVKEETGGVTSRNRPFDLKPEPGKCVVCGNPSPGMMVWSKAY